MVNNTEQPETGIETPAAPAVPAPWTFRNAIASAYRARYLCFKGRAGRKEFGYGFLPVILLDMLLRVGNHHVVRYCFMYHEEDWCVYLLMGWGIMGLLVSVLILIPWMALTARRLHDIGLSGWFAPCFFLPWYLGYLFTLICGLIPSAAPNKWGNGPEGPAVR